MSGVDEPSTVPSHDETVTLDRTLVDGEAIDEGLPFPANSPPLVALADTISPLISNPMLGEYVAALIQPEETDGEYAVGLGIFPAGSDGPPEHVHLNYDETFEVVEGTLAFEIDGESKTASAGETVTVEAGTPHAFHNESADPKSTVIESRPAGILGEVILFLYGLAYDGMLAKSGRPKFLQARVMADALGEDTILTSPPPAIQRVLAKVFGPVGRLVGYGAIAAEYYDDAVCQAHVEQPPAR